MSQSDAPVAITVARSSQEPPRLGGVAQVGLGDDLEQRHAGAVEVDERALGAGDAPAAAAAWIVLPASSSRWARVMPDAPPTASVAARRTAVGRTGRSGSPWAGRDRSSSCGRTSSARGISQPSASPTRSARSTASRLGTGSDARDARGRPGRRWCSARRRTRFGSRRTSSSRSAAGRGPRARSPPPTSACATSPPAAADGLEADRAARARGRRASSRSRANAGADHLEADRQAPPSSPHGIESAGRPARLTGA